MSEVHCGLDCGFYYINHSKFVETCFTAKPVLGKCVFSVVRVCAALHMAVGSILLSA